MNNSGNAKGANDKVVLALIGAGARGSKLIMDLYNNTENVEVKYICDVDSARGGHVIKELEKLQGFAPEHVKDMRTVYDDKDIDAVVIAAPEHWHALATIWACQAGKETYIEKVVSMNVVEGQKMIEATRKYKRIVQCGTQNRSGSYSFSARKYIREGKLGKIVHVKTFCQLPGAKPWSMKPTTPVPDGLDWDMWLGPAPFEPFSVSRHKAAYDWWVYSPGLQMAMTAHVVDLTRMVLSDPGHPNAVYCAGGRILYNDSRDVPDIQVCTFEYDDFSMTCENSVYGNYMTKSPPDVRFGNKFPDWSLSSTRIEIYGTDAVMYLGIMGGGWQVFGLNGDLIDQEYGYFPDANHLKDFIHCIRTGKEPNASITQGHYSSCLLHLANISYRVGEKKLLFDPKTELFMNSSLANGLAKGNYRAPYLLPDHI